MPCSLAVVLVKRLLDLRPGDNMVQLNENAVPSSTSSDGRWPASSRRRGWRHTLGSSTRSTGIHTYTTGSNAHRVALGRVGQSVFDASSFALQVSLACFRGSSLFRQARNWALPCRVQFLGRTECQFDIRPQCAGCKNRKQHGHVGKHF